MKINQINQINNNQINNNQINKNQMKLLNTQKIVIASLLLTFNTILCFTADAQWVENYYVDDFGDKTDQKYESFVAKGTFSNSATQNSEAEYIFIKDKESVIIKVYEYSRSLASSIDATFETIKIKQPNGSVATIKKVFFTKSGKLYFSEKQYTQLLESIKDIGTYTMVFDRSGKYSSSSYKIKFTIE
jgi:hypothetical protein